MEWLIDIIKEWVVKQAYATKVWVEAKLYATEAWVLTNFFTQTQILESTIPLDVSGDLTPDATGTYFATGVYNGRLYYRRTDGAYFIWWDTPCEDYDISTGLGVKAPGFWWGPWKNIEGEYGWASDYTGLPFVAEGYKYLSQGFVDRGDPADYDFVSAVLTKDGAWHELDLSSIVPLNAKGVALSVRAANDYIDKTVMFRKHGNVNLVAVSRFANQVARAFYETDCQCPLDDDRKIDYFFTAGGWSIITITVKNWWF